jgi:hypothetical protein
VLVATLNLSVLAVIKLHMRSASRDIAVSDWGMVVIENRGFGGTCQLVPFCVDFRLTGLSYLRRASYHKIQCLTRCAMCDFLISAYFFRSPSHPS